MTIKKTLLLGAALLLTAAPAHAEIVIGFVTGLSGPVSSIGIPNAKGLAAGQTYIGEVDGEKVRVIQLDDGSDATASTRNARKLVEQEKVDVLIGTSGAPQTLAMATAAVEMKVPMIAVSPIAPVPPGEGGPWVVQTPQPAPLLVQGIVDHMKKRGLKTVAFIGFSDAFGDLMYNSLVQSAAGADIKVVANERYARSDTSVTAQVLRAVSTKPDAIMLGGTGTPGALPTIALAERGYKGPLYGNHGMISAGLPAPCRQVGRRHHLPDRAGDGGRAASGEQSHPQDRAGLPHGLRESQWRTADRRVLTLRIRRVAGVYGCRQARQGHGRDPRNAGVPQCASRRVVHDQGSRRHPRRLHLHAGRSSRRRRSLANNGPDRKWEIQAAPMMPWVQNIVCHKMAVGGANAGT